MTTFITDPTSPTTHMPSTLRKFVRRIWTCMLELRARRAQTACLRRLKSRDLQDIGLVDNDISAASSLSLSTDAASALHRTRLARSGNW